MKKITLFSLFGTALIVASTLYAKEQRIWSGATDRLWDLATPNWSDPNSALSFLPTTSVDSATITFDNSTDSSKIKVNGRMIADSVIVNSSKNYVIDSIKATNAEIAGKGILIKKGTGTLEMDVKNSLLGGTIIYEGRVKMQNQTSPNIFGAKLILNGGIANFATTSASTYPSVTLPVEIPAENTGTVELSRYSYWSSPITGSGALQIYAGGDRTYLGQKNVQPVWKDFTGNVKVDKYVMSGVNPGFYGLIINTNKTFKDSLNGFGIDSTFYNRKLTLGTGITIGAESGTRAYEVGELNSTDSTSLLGGYYKDSTTPKIIYFIGGLNTDVTYPGRIGYIGAKAYNQTGIIKIGTGTYTFTNNNNQITNGLTIRQGRVLICDKNIKGNKNGGTGYTVFVKKNGTLGGTGRIGGAVDVYGTLQPGVDGIGTLLLSDSITANPLSKFGTAFKYSFTYFNTAATPVLTTFSFQNSGTRTTDLILREGSVSEFEIANTNSFDKVIATGSVRFNKDAVSAGKPKLKIKLAQGAIINIGDKFEIIKAKSLDAANSDGFDIEYPIVEGITWSVETKADTVKLEKETLTFTNHVVTKWTADSTVTTTISPDTMQYSYKVTLIASAKTGLKDISKTSTVSIYPNPSQGEFNFTSTGDEITSIEIINLQGQVILRKEEKTNATKLNLSNLGSGIYYAKVKTTKGTKVEKILIQ